MGDARRLQRPPPTPPGRLRHRGARRGPGAAGLRPGRLPVQRRPPPGQGRRPAATPGGRGGRGGGGPRRRLRRGGGQRAWLHQSDAVRHLRGRPGGGVVRRRAAGCRDGGAPRDRRHRLLGAQRGQGDARRPSAQHAHRRRPRPRPRVPGPRRAAGEPHRGLGHAVRHADRAPRRRRRCGQRGVVQRPGPQRVLRRGAPEVRQRPRLRRADPAPRGSAAGRRRRDAASLAHLRVGVDAPCRGGLCAARGAPDPRRRRGRELLQPVAARGGLRARREGPAGGERRGTVRVPGGLREPQRRAVAR